MLLAGDIGGTKTNLAVFSAEAGLHAPLAEKTFPSDEYPSLQALAQTFLDSLSYSVRYASFGVAGPVVKGQVKATNLPWEMDERTLCHALGVERAFLLNDLESVANAIPELNADDLVTLNAGEAAAGGSIGVIAPGTGLGEGFLTWTGSAYRAHPSEGGHSDFAPSTARELALLEYWQTKRGHVSYEWVCSGLGIGHIYQFLKDSGDAPEPDWLSAKIAEAEDPNPVIMHAALNEDVPLCEHTLDLFVSILGAETGNLALKLLATGGMYLGGGIPLRILPTLQDGRFMKAFLHKGRFNELLRQMPVKVILNPKAGLMGAAAYGLAMAEG
jgi:glucokinase